jgi:hypothetical protein
MPHGIYFVPDWTSQGPGYEVDLYDGAFSWDMWPEGPRNVSLAPDEAWAASLKPIGKSYMMGKLQHDFIIWNSADHVKAYHHGFILTCLLITKPGSGAATMRGIAGGIKYVGDY